MSQSKPTIKALGVFIRDVRAEFGKITWPPRKELFESTWIVAALILALGAFVLLCDQILTVILRWLMR